MSSFLPDQIAAAVPSVAALTRSPKVQAGVAALAVLGTLSQLNEWLSRRKTNNFLTDKSWDWSKEIVVVTGGSSGIGATIVEKLQHRGIKIIVLDINKPSKEFGKNTSFYQVDLSDALATASVADRICHDHGDPTVLVNNAGIGHGTSILSTSEATLQRCFGINLFAPYRLIQQFLPAMVRRNHGHIVNVGSMASFTTQVLNVDYGMTKSGVLALHEGLKQELLHIYNAPAVRATVVHPSWVRTPMAEAMIKTNKLPGAYVTADDVAGAITRQLFSGYGAQIVVPDSGWWISMMRGLPIWI
ncbi:uncharacterized protein B0I36DRAFT_298755 [Microdochium trichocladiopsis]|uniref:Uncharacterized protein n=1 Tax=Microdochium trichocladiopsis TaxID=1682393 RepID=A0A9P8XTE0_9PEZI|nr:uncharacterized protein B0I36DRAFT_298755 [Microdochium trichocladiopsis]KAH7016411.1 hypothetical protein B0I36DRAFT_298755 [Microdochium trichocladiopsis]